MAMPRMVVRPVLMWGNRILWASGGASLLVFILGGLIILNPSLKGELIFVAQLSEIAALCLFIAWGALHIMALLSLLWRSRRRMADQLDANMVQVQEVVDYVKDWPLAKLQSWGRLIAFESKMCERSEKTAALIGGLGAAVTALITVLPIHVWQGSEMLRSVVPAFLLGTVIGTIAKHEIGECLLRVGLAISEAEHVMSAREDGTRAASSDVS